LIRPPVLARRWIDLSVRGREPRGALDVDLDVRGRRVRVVNTHLGLRPGERAWQAERLLASLSPGFEDVLVVMGDFNEWHRWGRARALLERELGGVSSRATFPAWRPWLALDRVWVRPHARVVDVRVVATPATRQASDHLPLRVEFDLG
jgi:endonuclease/exonuclease/phosphatase family metal-dependent hydrolase